LQVWDRTKYRAYTSTVLKDHMDTKVANDVKNQISKRKGLLRASFDNLKTIVSEYVETWQKNETKANAIPESQERDQELQSIFLPEKTVERFQHDLLFLNNKFAAALQQILQDRSTYHYLPVFYSNFDRYGFRLFSAFLTQLGFYHLVIHPDDPTEVRQELIRLANLPHRKFIQDTTITTHPTFPYRPMTYAEVEPKDLERLGLDRFRTNADKDRLVPVCVVLHPDLVEGVSFSLSPSLILNEPANSFGKSQQLYARIIRALPSLSPYDYREVAYKEWYALYMNKAKTVEVQPTPTTLRALAGQNIHIKGLMDLYVASLRTIYKFVERWGGTEAGELLKAIKQRALPYIVVVPPTASDSSNSNWESLTVGIPLPRLLLGTTQLTALEQSTDPEWFAICDNRSNPSPIRRSLVEFLYFLTFPLDTVIPQVIQPYLNTVGHESLLASVEREQWFLSLESFHHRLYFIGTLLDALDQFKTKRTEQYPKTCFECESEGMTIERAQYKIQKGDVVVRQAVLFEQPAELKAKTRPENKVQIQLSDGTVGTIDHAYLCDPASADSSFSSSSSSSSSSSPSPSSYCRAPVLQVELQDRSLKRCLKQIYIMESAHGLTLDQLKLNDSNGRNIKGFWSWTNKVDTTWLTNFNTALKASTLLLPSVKGMKQVFSWDIVELISSKAKGVAVESLFAQNWEMMCYDRFYPGSWFNSLPYKPTNDVLSDHSPDELTTLRNSALEINWRNFESALRVIKDADVQCIDATTEKPCDIWIQNPFSITADKTEPAVFTKCDDKGVSPTNDKGVSPTNDKERAIALRRTWYQQGRTVYQDQQARAEAAREANKGLMTKALDSIVGKGR
jgi:hypothetical protein